jgi:hypothetical protein
MAPRVEKPATQEQRPQPATRLQAYRESVVDWAEKRLKPYVQRIEALPSLRDKAGKEIHDAVWRTISLTPFEVLILDSPLVQRLRRVRQLGVVHWVYPGAGHSRLEHSLGAVHQVQRHSRRSTATRARAPAGLRPPPLSARDCRSAALPLAVFLKWMSPPEVRTFAGPGLKQE